MRYRNTNDEYLGTKDNDDDIFVPRRGGETSELYSFCDDISRTTLSFPIEKRKYDNYTITREMKIYPDEEGEKIRTISMYMRRCASKVDEFWFVDLSKYLERSLGCFHRYFSRSHETTKKLFYLVVMKYLIVKYSSVLWTTIPKTNAEIPDRTANPNCMHQSSWLIKLGLIYSSLQHVTNAGELVKKFNQSSFLLFWNEENVYVF